MTWKDGCPAHICRRQELIALKNQRNSKPEIKSTWCCCQSPQSLCWHRWTSRREIAQASVLNIALSEQPNSFKSSSSLNVVAKHTFLRICTRMKIALNEALQQWTNKIYSESIKFVRWWTWSTNKLVIRNLIKICNKCKQTEILASNLNSE